MYIVHVRIEVQPAAVDAFLAATADNQRHTRYEPGNLRFDVARSLTDANRFMFYEVYHSEDDFRAHQQTAHYQRWRTAVDGLMAVPRVGERYASVLPEPYA